MVFLYAVLGLVANEKELSLNEKETKVMTIINCYYNNYWCA